MSINTQHLAIVASDTSPRAPDQTPDPIAWIESDHRLQLKLLDLLEQVADSLPHDLDPRLAILASSFLREAFSTHHAFEERVLFPMLRRRANADPGLQNVLRQLEEEHDCDETFAEEIAEELDYAAANGAPGNADMLGYMLRGFFTCQRRHIEWENATVIPLARRVLTVSDLSELQRSILSDNAHAAVRERWQSLTEGVSGGECTNCGKCDGGCRD